MKKQPKNNETPSFQGPALDYLNSLNTESEQKAQQDGNSGNHGANNRNFVFNNCSVTINEEGKAVGILEAKQKLEGEKMVIVAKFMEIATSTLKDYLDKKHSVPAQNKVW